MSDSSEPDAAPPHDSGDQLAGAGETKTVPLVIRSLFGGTLMGLANLVPGISGGTMLLAAGVYPRFIEALAEVTRFRFSFRTLLVLGCIVAAAGLGILLLAGTLKELVVDSRWVMYSLFIGRSLGYSAPVTPAPAAKLTPCCSSRPDWLEPAP